MVEFIDDLLDTMDNLPSWGKIFGISSLIGLVVLFLFLLFLSQQPGGNDAVKIPSTINEIKDNTTTIVVQAGVDSSVTAGTQIVTSFNKAGNDMASTVKDLVVAGEIVFLMTLAGFCLAGAVSIAILEPIVDFVQVLNDSFPF